MIRTSDSTIQATPPSPRKIDDDNKKHEKGTNYTHESTSTMDGHEETKGQYSIMIEKGFAKFRWLIAYTPKRCRYDPESPPKFNMALNLLFASACTFTVANLYYSHPILNILAEEFNVSNERASIIPTVMQAGYAAGLLFICPLGDIYKRRSFVLILIFCTATMWLGLCLTNSFPVFVGTSFLAALTTVTPQLMLPLVGDLAPPHRRATCLAIVSSGLILGLLIARLLSGILTQFTTWRTIYWFALSLQYLIFTLLYLFMPDYPSTNPGTFNYLTHLRSIIHLFLTQPLLIQASLIGLSTSALFTTYWTTLTFLLSFPPYSLPPIPISLLSLLGILTLLLSPLSPLSSHLIIDKYPPLYSSILGLLSCLLGTIIGTFSAYYSIAGPILQAIFLDLGVSICMIANRCAVFGIDKRMRNRINTVYMGWVFVGQLLGTLLGNRLFEGLGWRGSSGGGGVFILLGLGCALGRGPWEKGWVGWGGGWGVRRVELDVEVEAVEVVRVEDELRDGEMGERGGAVDGADTGEAEKEMHTRSLHGGSDHGPSPNHN